MDRFILAVKELNLKRLKNFPIIIKIVVNKTQTKITYSITIKFICEGFNKLMIAKTIPIIKIRYL